MKLARVILFTGQMEKMSKYYGEVLGLGSRRKKRAGANFRPEP